MSDQRRRDPGIVDDRQFGGFWSRGVQPRQCPVRGAAADGRRIIQVGEPDLGIEVVVALHPGARTNQCRRADGMAGPDPMPGESG